MSLPTKIKFDPQFALVDKDGKPSQAFRDYLIKLDALVAAIAAGGAPNGLVNAMIHQIQCFTQMCFIHDQTSFRRRSGRKVRRLSGRIEAHFLDAVESRHAWTQQIQVADYGAG